MLILPYASKHLVSGFLDPKNIPSKHQTSGGMTGRLGVNPYFFNAVFTGRNVSIQQIVDTLDFQGGTGSSRSVVKG